MKKIEEKMCAAVAAGRWFKESNTEVQALSTGAIFVKLYDTYIYAKIDGVEYFSDGGYNTVTTGSRLRALGACAHKGQGSPSRYNTGPVYHSCTCNDR